MISSLVYEANEDFSTVITFNNVCSRAVYVRLQDALYFIGSALAFLTCVPLGDLIGQWCFQNSMFYFMSIFWHQLQDASYYKMLGSISWPKIDSEQTTRPIVMKFGRNVPDIIQYKLIDAFFEILPLARDIGPHRGDPQGGAKSQKIFSNFFIVFNLVV